MSIIKKILASAMAVLMTVSMAACSPNNTSGGKYAVKYADVEVSPAVYTYYQTIAVSQATTKIPYDEEFKNKFIDGYPVADWINKQTLEYLKSYVSAEQKFNEYKLKLDDEDMKKRDQLFNDFWTANQKLLKANNVDEKAVKSIIENDLKKDKIFYHIYGENSEKGLSSAELEKFFQENFARVQFIPMRLVDGKSQPMTDEQKAETYKKAEYYADEIRKGTEFYSLYLEYANDYSATIAEAMGVPRQDEPYDPDYDRSKLEEVLKKGTGNPSPALVDAAFKMKPGDVQIVEDNEMGVYYVLEILDKNENPEFYENLKPALIMNLYANDFTKDLIQWEKEVEFEINDAVIEKLDPLKIKMDVK